MDAGPSTTEARLLAGLIGFAPVLILALTWEPDGASSTWAMTVREYALPILVVEGIVIGLAAVSGWLRWLRNTPAPILAAAGAWFVVAYYTAIWVAVDPRLSLFLTTVWIIHALFGAAVAFLCTTGRLDLRELGLALMGGFVLYATALALFGLQLDHAIMWTTDFPGLGNLRRVSAYATITAGLSAGALIWPRYRLALIGIVAAFFTGFWTGSRATALAVIIAIVSAAALLPRARNWRIIGGSLAALVAGLLLALAYPVSPGAGNDEMRAIFERSGNSRELIWPNTLRTIQQSPWIGFGEGQTAYVLPDNPKFKDDFQAHPHNLFLQLMIAWGAVGTFAVLFIAVWLVRMLYRAGQSVDTLPFVIGAGALTVNAMVDGALYDVAPVFLFAACVGAACAGPTKQIYEPQPVA